jgi:hypothetical protein
LLMDNQYKYPALPLWFPILENSAWRPYSL